jgi:hypothetical protein
VIGQFIKDPELHDILSKTDPNEDAWPTVKAWLGKKNPDIAKQAWPEAGEETTPPAEGGEETGGMTPPAEGEDETAGMEPPAEGGMTPPVAEGGDNDPPWDVDPSDRKSKPVTPGKHGQGYSQARHLARQGMADAMKKAKKAGATLETQLDFGHGVKTIQEILDECGMSPQEVGMEMPIEGGLPAMLKFISGFYNRDEGNFPLGGMRIKIKVKKGFEDGEFGEASDDDLIKVLKFIDCFSYGPFTVFLKLILKSLLEINFEIYYERR